MKLTNETRKIIYGLYSNNCIPISRQTKNTKNLLLKLYNEITNGINYINNIKKKLGDSFYKLNINPILNVKQIPKPNTFPSNSFPKEIRQNIDEQTINSFAYSYKLFGRNIKIFFVTEDINAESKIETYNSYVDFMLVWLYIIDQYSSKNCVTDINIYIYHTLLLKRLPKSNIDILDETHVNTAFTRTCPKISEIVVFRKEEWFKVFMHETFHNFGLDFSDMNNESCKKEILSIFPVNSDVNLFESYAEFWARIMNALFCSYIAMKNKNNIEEFLQYAEYFINIERTYSFFQMVKVLNFMGISYKMLYHSNSYAENMRNTLYKEKTNVLAYYIITSILMNNYQGFLSWCDSNNTSLLQFKKTNINLKSFCEFIKKKYKTISMIDGVECTEKLLHDLIHSKNNKKTNNIDFLLENLRMTACELG